jgi:hypothetical protein
MVTLPGPRHLASPICGVAGQPAMLAGNQLTHPRSYNSPGAPTWASVARGEGACAVKNIRPLQQPAVSAEDFTALYERCLASGLKARVVFSHAAGCQTISVSCTFPVPAVPPPLPVSAAAAIAATIAAVKGFVEGAVELPPLRRRFRPRLHPPPLPPQPFKRCNLQCPCCHLKTLLLP